MEICLGIQLYQFPRTMFDEQKQRILQRISELGYQAVEGLPACRDNYADICRQYQLSFLGPHIVTAELREIDSLIEYCLSTGAQHVVSSGPLGWDQRSRLDYEQTAAVLNSAAKALQQHNILLHYHNHEFEFEMLDDAHRAFDILLAETDPIVEFCVDLGWVARAGVNPVHCLLANADRISYVHLRDFAGEQSVPLGAGDLDLEEILGTLMELPGISNIIVEQDPNSPDPLKAAEQSITYLRRLVPQLC